MPAQVPLSRSLINDQIRQAIGCFKQFGIALPPFAYWTADQWQAPGLAAEEVRDCMLGWDVTDFGSGDFYRTGRVLFTLRNGTVRKSGYPKPYAEKLLFDPEIQRAPAHYHRSKMEDICCRGGGNILVQLWPIQDGGKGHGHFTVKVDGFGRQINGGDIIRLEPGMSVNIPPGTIHQFWAEEGRGLTVSSEVSNVCDDWNDNMFLETAERFPAIVEDAPKQHLLCHEYPGSENPSPGSAGSPSTSSPR